jgi:hypothetical protein
MRFPVTHNIMMATQLSVLYEVVSLATQSILGCLPIHVPQAGVVGDIVV